MNRSMYDALMKKMEEVIRQNAALDEKIDEQRVLLEQSTSKNYLHPIPRPRQGKEMNRSVNIAEYLRMEIETRNENIPADGRKYLQFPSTLDDDRANREAIRTLEGLLSYHLPEDFGYHTWEQTYACKPRLCEKLVREASVHQDLKVFAQAAAQWAIRMLISSKMKTRKRSLRAQQNVENTEEETEVIPAPQETENVQTIVVRGNAVATSSVPDLVVDGVEVGLEERDVNHPPGLEIGELRSDLIVADIAGTGVNNRSGRDMMGSASGGHIQNISLNLHDANTTEEQHLHNSNNESGIGSKGTGTENAERGSSSGVSGGRGNSVSGISLRGNSSRRGGVRRSRPRGGNVRRTVASGINIESVSTRGGNMRGSGARRVSVGRGISRSGRGGRTRGITIRNGITTFVPNNGGLDRGTGTEGSAIGGIITRNVVSSEEHVTNQGIQDSRNTTEDAAVRCNQIGSATNQRMAGESSRTTTRKRGRTNRSGAPVKKAMKPRNSNL